MDWYYKRPDENGKLRLHYCKLCNGVVLYASQNDPALAAHGLYDHGKYPFVFDRCSWRRIPLPGSATST